MVKRYVFFDGDETMFYLTPSVARKKNKSFLFQFALETIEIEPTEEMKTRCIRVPRECTKRRVVFLTKFLQVTTLSLKATTVSTPLRLSHGSRPPGRHPPHAHVTGQTIPARPRRRRIHRGGFIRLVNVLSKWKFQPLAKDDALSSSRARRDGRVDGRHERRRVRGFRKTVSSVEEYYCWWQ